MRAHRSTLLTEMSPKLPPRAPVFVLVAMCGVLLTGAGLVGVLWSLWWRWRRAPGEPRQQIACLLPAGGVFLLGLVLDSLGLPGGWLLAVVAVPPGMTLAILRGPLVRPRPRLQPPLRWAGV